MFRNPRKILLVLLSGLTLAGVLAAPMPLPSSDVDGTTAVNGTRVHPITDIPCRGCIRELKEVSETL